MKYHTVIFDMDGVVIDSAMLWNNSTTQLLASHGIEYNFAEVRPKVAGTSLKDSTEIIREHYKLAIAPEDFLNQRKSFIEKEFENNMEFIPGFLNFHQQLLGLGIKTGIATSAYDDLVNFAIRKLGLMEIFSGHLYKASDVGDRSKPDPAVYLHAAQMLQSPPEQCMVVEDAPKGIDAAHNAGMKCIGITTTFPRELITHADWVVDRYEEVQLPQVLN